MKIDILTLFPKMFEGPLTESMLKKACEKGILDVKIHNIRDYTNDKHHTADDAAYGGGGMLLKPEPIYKAIQFLKKKSTVHGLRSTVILMTPDGEVFTQKMAKQLARCKRLIVICGHYEGVDERVRKIADKEISIGDYVLTGGEIPAMVVIDVVARMIKGVVGKERAPKEDSFYNGILDCPHYTRPPEFRGTKVPKILLSGNHEKIRQWRYKTAVQRTKKRRPDLLKKIA